MSSDIETIIGPDGVTEIRCYRESVIVPCDPNAQPDAHRLPDGRRMVVLVLDADEAAAALASYDPTSSTSPSAADSRRIARAVLDALKAAEESP